MSEQRFHAGQEFSYAGVQYRVLQGTRCDGDLVIEFSLPPGWHRPAIAHTLILAEFKYQVEENNYGAEGKVQRGQGGWYLLSAIKEACDFGWAHVAQRVKDQRLAAERRRASYQRGDDNEVVSPRL